MGSDSGYHALADKEDRIGRIQKRGSVARCQLQILVHGPSGPMRRRREDAGVRRCCHQIPTLKAANEKER
jgi:hypothetical protein